MKALNLSNYAPGPVWEAMIVKAETALDNREKEAVFVASNPKQTEMARRAYREVTRDQEVMV